MPSGELLIPALFLLEQTPSMNSLGKRKRCQDPTKAGCASQSDTSPQSTSTHPDCAGLLQQRIATSQTELGKSSIYTRELPSVYTMPSTPTPIPECDSRLRRPIAVMRRRSSLELTTELILRSVVCRSDMSASFTPIGFEPTQLKD